VKVPLTLTLSHEAVCEYLTAQIQEKLFQKDAEVTVTKIEVESAGGGYGGTKGFTRTLTPKETP